MMSQIGSRVEYLIPTDNILLLPLHSNLIQKSSLIGGFLIQFKANSELAHFLLSHPVYRTTMAKVRPPQPLYIRRICVTEVREPRHYQKCKQNI